MVRCQTIERQLLRRQCRAEVGITLLIAGQYRPFERGRPRPVRWLPTTLMQHRDRLVCNNADTAAADADNPKPQSAAASFCCNSPRFTLRKIFSRSRSFALITKSPSICPPFRVSHPRGLFYSVSQRAVLYSYHTVAKILLTPFLATIKFCLSLFRALPLPDLLSRFEIHNQII